VNLSVPATVQYLGPYAVGGRSLKAIYFYGNAPNTDPGASFDWNGVTVYYLSGTSGWTGQYNGAVTSMFADSIAPTAVVGVRGNGQVPLSWTAPGAVDGLPVKDYTIQYSSDGSSWQTFSDAASATTSATVTGLTNGTGYVFRIAAVSDFGTGDYSANSSVVTPSSSLEFTCTTSNGQITITGYNGSAATVEIPATIDGLPVTSIGDTAFQGKSLTGVTIPSSVKTIGYKAFDGCQGLTSITIPSSVTSLGAGAFNQCSLTTISIPASVTSIGDNPFAGCILLTSIAVSPDNTAYTSRDGVLYTKDGTILIACPGGRTGDFTIPAGVTSVAASSFSHCLRLTGITIPDTVTYLGYSAFWNCSGLTTMFIPDSVSDMNNGVFFACENLRSVRLSPSLTQLSGWLFLGCHKLTDVTIPASVTVVNAGAFKDCRSLASIVIPAGVTDIGWEAYRGCTSLTSISLPETVKAIPADAFLFCSQLKDITIPAGVTSIGSRAFESCESLASIVIPAGVTSMGNEVFKGCTSLTVVRMQRSPPTIGTAVFGGVNPSRAGVYYPAGTDGWTDTFGGLPAWPYGVPGMPTAVAGIRSNGQVQLSWTAPASNGGRTVTDYTIQYSSDSGSSWQTFTDAVSAATSATVTGLTNGTGYLFRVASVNDVGTGSYSAISSAVTPATTPGTPTAVVGIRGNGQVQLLWTAPVSNGGLTLTDYTIQYSSNSGASWQTFSRVASTAPSVTVTGLRNGTAYLFRLASVNDVGAGSFTATSSSITPGAVPLPPTNVTATRGKGIVIVSWTAPVSTGGVRITDYRVQQSTNDGLSWVTVRDGVSTKTITVVSGLVMGRNYIFRVSSVGGFGAGDFSSPSRVVVPATVPSVPVGLLATGGVGQVALSWRAPTSNGGSPINQYIVQYSLPAGRWRTSTTVGSDTTTVTVGGLLANRSYSLRVLAVNDMGNSPSSRVVVARTLRPAVVRV